MYRYRKKRVYRILGLLGLAGGMFLVFQLFSMEILSFHAKREDSRIRNSFIAKKELGKVDDAKLSVRVTHKTPGPADKMDPDCLEGNCDNSVHIVNKNVHDKVVKYGVDKYKQQADLIRTTIKDSHYEKLVAKCKALSIGSKEDLWQFLEYCFADTHSPGNSSVRGVFSGWAHLYRADSNGMFTCIKSQEKISFKLINDDYCDCSDGSDEPGTSACGGSRFYCTFQVSGGAPTWFPSSRVDDMLCDCCDGSDEPRKSLLPHHVVLDSKTQYYGVRQAPCSDQCQELVSKGQALAEMREQGAVIKQAYIQAAMGQDNVKQIYGEDGAFYKLSQICINANSDKYVYEVCPFRHVKQSWSTLPFKMIGRDGEWMSTGRRGWTLKMGNGESNQCPGMRARVSFIKFHCGLKDAVMTVGETEVCEYTVHFSTPAAC